MRLDLIACRTPFGPGLAPIMSLSCSPAEIGRVEKACQVPAVVFVNVGGEPQLGALPHTPRQRVDHALRYKAPLVVPPFWPGVRVEHEHPRKERVWGSLDDLLCIATPQAHIRKAPPP